jgi:mono/diheme cytochrome c family protein
MKMLSIKFGILLAICSVGLVSSLYAGKSPNAKEAGTVAAVHAADADAMRVQGEQRFRANCGRCHAAPQKFPPRMMATVLRHMRVRATITDEDMRLVLFYMTQ